MKNSLWLKVSATMSVIIVLFSASYSFATGSNIPSKNVILGKIANIKVLEATDSKLPAIQEFAQQKANENKLAPTGVSSGFLSNPDFENGHSAWGEYTNGVSGTSIIWNSSVYAANGSYSAWLFSTDGYMDNLMNSFVVPANTASLTLGFNSRFTKYFSCTGESLFTVYVYDATASQFTEIQTIKDASWQVTEENYGYQNIYLNNDISSRVGHQFVIGFSSINDNPADCPMFLDLDDVSLKAITSDSPTHTPMYRLYNTLNGAYLYTRGDPDRVHVLGSWPEFEYTDGVPAFYSSITPQSGQTPMYRLYNTKNGAYLYVRGDADKTHVMNTWPEFEFTDGVPAFYAPLTDTGGLTPIYRLYNNLNGMYLYTRGLADRNHVTSTWPEFEFTDGVPAFYAALN